MDETTLSIVSQMSQFVLMDKDLLYDEEEFLEKLVNQGYSEKEIWEAYHWVQKITLFDRLPDEITDTEGASLRVFDPEETYRMTIEARGFLWKLRAAGVIDDHLQEEIIVKLLSLDAEEIQREDVTVIAAITIFTHFASHFSGKFDKGALPGLQDSDPIP